MKKTTIILFMIMLIFSCKKEKSPVTIEITLKNSEDNTKKTEFIQQAIEITGENRRNPNNEKIENETIIVLHSQEGNSTVYKKEDINLFYNNNQMTNERIFPTDFDLYDTPCFYVANAIEIFSVEKDKKQKNLPLVDKQRDLENHIKSAIDWLKKNEPYEFSYGNYQDDHLNTFQKDSYYNEFLESWVQIPELKQTQDQESFFDESVPWVISFPEPTFLKKIVVTKANEPIIILEHYKKEYIYFRSKITGPFNKISYLNTVNKENDIIFAAEPYSIENIEEEKEEETIEWFYNSDLIVRRKKEKVRNENIDIFFADGETIIIFSSKDYRDIQILKGNTANVIFNGYDSDFSEIIKTLSHGNYIYYLPEIENIESIEIDKLNQIAIKINILNCFREKFEAEDIIKINNPEGIWKNENILDISTNLIIDLEARENKNNYNFLEKKIPMEIAKILLEEFKIEVNQGKNGYKIITDKAKISDIEEIKLTFDKNRENLAMHLSSNKTDQLIFFSKQKEPIEYNHRTLENQEGYSQSIKYIPLSFNEGKFLYAIERIHTLNNSEQVSEFWLASEGKEIKPIPENSQIKLSEYKSFFYFSFDNSGFKIFQNIYQSNGSFFEQKEKTESFDFLLFYIVDGR
ncbi:MAG: hypothetical protein JXR63_03855 [Spirochaetales bacterium]|nr:hypothetical protein [Spirochaetales bacterium]